MDASEQKPLGKAPASRPADKKLLSKKKMEEMAHQQPKPVEVKDQRNEEKKLNPDWYGDYLVSM